MTHPSANLIAAQHRTGQAIVEYLPLRPWQLRDLSAQAQTPTEINHNPNKRSVLMNTSTKETAEKLTPEKLSERVEGYLLTFYLIAMLHSVMREKKDENSAAEHMEHLKKEAKDIGERIIKIVTDNAALDAAPVEAAA